MMAYVLIKTKSTTKMDNSPEQSKWTAETLMRHNTWLITIVDNQKTIKIMIICLGKIPILRYLMERWTLLMIMILIPIPKNYVSVRLKNSNFLTEHVQNTGTDQLVDSITVLSI